MRPTSAALIVLAAVLAGSPGCELTSTLGTLGDDVADASNSESAGESGSTAADTAASESGDSLGSESSSESTSASETGFDTMMDPTFGEGGPDMCMPGPGADVCTLCVAEFCCFEWMACLGSPSCTCMLDCEGNLPPPDCGMLCMPDLHYFELMQCRDGPCGGVC